MPRCASHYHISQLIYRVFVESGLKRSPFIKSLGYRNITGGLRSLDRWLDSGTGDPMLINRMVQVYNLDTAVVGAALVETEAQHGAESEQARRRREQWERQNFRQYVFVETPSGVLQSSFTVAAIAAPALKVIALPEDLREQPEADQIDFVIGVIEVDFAMRDGKLPLFGEIVGYSFVNAYDASIRFDTAGNVVARVSGHFVGPKGIIQIGQKTVEPGLLTRMLRA